METFQMWFKNSLECSKVTVFQENVILEDESLKILDEIVEKTNTLNEEIVSYYLIHMVLNSSVHLSFCFIFIFQNQKKIIVGEMLKELNDKKSDFGLMEIKTVMDNLAENYLNTNNDNNLINKMVTSIKASVINDVNNMNKLTIRSTPR